MQEPVRSTPCLLEREVETSSEEVGSAIFDSNLKLLSWNSAYFKLLQLPSAFARIGRDYVDFLRFEGARFGLKIGENERYAAQIMRDVGEAQPHRSTIVRADGVEIVSIAVPQYGGGLSCICSRSQNDRVELNVGLSSSVASTRSDILDALDSMADGLAVFDADDRMLFCNERFRAYHDRIADRLLPGVKYATLLSEAFERGQYETKFETPDKMYKAHKRALRGDVESFETNLYDGRWLHCSETKTTGGLTISIRSDITELKRREVELTRLSHALKAQNLHFNTALNNMVQGLCLFDAEKRLIVANQRYLDLYGFSADVVKPGINLTEILSYSLSLGNYTDEVGPKAFMERDEQANSSEQSISEQYLRDGRVIAVLHQPMAGGGSVATYEDITARKRAELELSRHTATLESRNKELNNFAYVASHDLQEPLRKIESFGGRLKSRCAAQLGDDGKDYLERVLSAAQRMRSLIFDLLEYSRVSTNEAPQERCNLNVVAREVVSDLEVTITEKNAQIYINQLPTVEAVPTYMRQLFQNIFANSLKFSRKDVTPMISVTATIEKSRKQKGKDAFHLLTFRDNGIGFDQKYAEQIFGIFQRLHGRTSYDGTGIGLATVRRIAELHGGTIEARGYPGEGAEFQVRLPITNSATREMS